MSILQQGEWAIMSVKVNSETVMNYEGFVQLNISGEEFSIEPIGLQFAIRQVTPGAAVLESQGQTYFADFELNDEQLTLTLTRPKFHETVTISAQFQPGFVPV